MKFAHAPQARPILFAPLLLCALAALAGSAAAQPAQPARPNLPDIQGIRLGMTVSEVKARLAELKLKLEIEERSQLASLPNSG